MKNEFRMGVGKDGTIVLIGYSRTACSALAEFRELFKRRANTIAKIGWVDYTRFVDLIEELQSYYSRMEEGLWRTRDQAFKIYELVKNDQSDLAKEVTQLLLKRWEFEEDKL